MPRLTAQELKEVSAMKPVAECVTCYPCTCVVIAINHFDCDEIIANVNEKGPARYKICIEYDGDEDEEGRSFFTAQGRRYYLDEIVRYNTPWMGGRV